MRKHCNSPILRTSGGHAASECGKDEQICASYIADMTAELAQLARAADLGILAYLLEMAAIEARSALAEDS